MPSATQKPNAGNGYGAGTFVETRLLMSRAFKSLGQKGSAHTVSSCSVQILMLFLAKRRFSQERKVKGGGRKYERTDDNRFHMSYAELESHGFHRQRVTRAIDELLAKGFIEILDPGGAYEKHQAVYGLVDDFSSWSPGVCIRKRERDARRGYQGRPWFNRTITTRVDNPHPHAGQQTTPPTQDTRVDNPHPKNTVFPNEK